MTDLPKIIWLLWLQGIDNAPELVKRVIKTWRDNNPEWDVRVLTKETLSDYISTDHLDLPNMTSQAASDIIRLRLMYNHGGVWADATMACLQPLDNWVYEAIEPAGFWMYHGRDRGRGPASWFMISKKQSLLAERWIKKTDEFWSKKPIKFEYCWMDILFAQIAKTDKEFCDTWGKVPYLYCELALSAHCFARIVFKYDPILIEKIAKNPPFAIKMCFKGDFHERTNAWMLLDKIDNKQIEYPKIKWDNPPSLVHARFYP